MRLHDLVLRLWLPGVLGLAACTAKPTPTESAYPPRDFFLEVRAGERTDDGTVVAQCVQVWRDGLVLYREARPGEAGVPAAWPPVFENVCAYRLTTESVRLLSRLLVRSSYWDLPASIGEAQADRGPVVAVRLRGFDRDHAVEARGRGFGAFVRTLHVVNAFLPRDRAFHLPEMTGEPEPNHVTAVPEPLRSAAEAIPVHEALADREPGGDGLLVDACVLAIACGDRPRAESLLVQIEAREKAAAGPAESRPRPVSALLRERLGRSE